MTCSNVVLLCRERIKFVAFSVFEKHLGKANFTWEVSTPNFYELLLLRDTKFIVTI